MRQEFERDFALPSVQDTPSGQIVGMLSEVEFKQS